MVIGGSEDKPAQNVDDESIENHDEAIEIDNGVDSNATKDGASFPFSDNARARIRKVKCHLP